MNYYQILQIETTATLAEIKASYRRLAMQYHPDQNKSPEAEEKIKLINAAYDALTKSKSFRPAPSQPAPPRPQAKPFVRNGEELFFRFAEKSVRNAYLFTLPEDVISRDAIVLCMIGGTEFRVKLPEGTVLPIHIEITNAKEPIRMRFEQEIPPMG